MEKVGALDLGEDMPGVGEGEVEGGGLVQEGRGEGGEVEEGGAEEVGVELEEMGGVGA